MLVDRLIRVVGCSARNPGYAFRHLWFRTFHQRRPPHDLLCKYKGRPITVRSNSVLAKPLYQGFGFEETEIDFLTSVAKIGMRVLDIGANIGLYTILLAHKVGPQGRVWSFEPFAPVRGLLYENVKNNGLKNVEVIDKAVAERSGEAVFHVFQNGADVYNSLGAQFRIEGLRAMNEVVVDVISLDNFAANSGLDSVDIIKIDVEGAEELVVRGGAKLIGSSKSVVILSELYEPSARQCMCSTERLVRLLSEWGFSMYSVGENGELLSTSVEHLKGTCAVFKR